MEQREAIKHSVVDKGPKVLAAVAMAFGGPYAALVSAFFAIASSIGGKEQAPDVHAEEGYYQQGQPGGETGYAPEPVARPQQELAVEIDVVKEVYVNGRYQARRVADGDVLTRNDNYKAIFRCNMRCYMYIVQLDSTGKMDPIFPSKHFAWGNPVQPHTVFSLPPENKWFYLDENTGVETIYFIASRSRRMDLEQLFRKFGERNKSLVQLSPVSLDSTVVITRGIGGVREGRKQTVKFQDGSKGQFSSTLFSSIQADFVMTRWFYHQ